MGGTTRTDRSALIQQERGVGVCRPRSPWSCSAACAESLRCAAVGRGGV